MRIDGPGRTVSTPAAAASRGGSSGGFTLSEAPSSEAPRAATAMRSAPSLDALMALQAMPEDPRERRRREVKRGRGLLDALDGLRLAMLDGAHSPEALAALARNTAERQPTGDAGLDDLLSAIDLRARVELAKRGQ
ncbi:flagellar assembly protein FliX [Hansschlegelia quercus]|uniref:Flagellar assembly regulator FliX n=1 Tax=Hansschlegelia quercus TaxID=2528245 RepID=A0A4Q9GTE1_9HYPH|nr:flagellar assembly protein FliX [Hansschlegelia quercus]TBN55077.1 flagellar assembly regulator FliX [Hansschlegelia quercus]